MSISSCSSLDVSGLIIRFLDAILDPSLRQVSDIPPRLLLQRFKVVPDTQSWDTSRTLLIAAASCPGPLSDSSSWLFAKSTSHLPIRPALLSLRCALLLLWPRSARHGQALPRKRTATAPASRIPNKATFLRSIWEQEEKGRPSVVWTHRPRSNPPQFPPLSASCLRLTHSPPDRTEHPGIKPRSKIPHDLESLPPIHPIVVGEWPTSSCVLRANEPTHQPNLCHPLYPPPPRLITSTTTSSWPIHPRLPQSHHLTWRPRSIASTSTPAVPLQIVAHHVLLVRGSIGPGRRRWHQCEPAHLHGHRRLHRRRLVQCD